MPRQNALDERKLKGLKHAIEHIDRHRDVYATIDAQNDMLQELIDKHDLMMNLWKNAKIVGEGKLTVHAYRNWFFSCNDSYGEKFDRSDSKLTQLFMKGSLRVSDVGKRNMGISSRSGRDGPLDEESVDDVRPLPLQRAATIDTAFTAASARDHQTVVRSPPETRVSFRRTADHSVGKALSAPDPSPITPWDVGDGTGDKRKLNAVDNGEAEGTLPRKAARYHFRRSSTQGAFDGNEEIRVAPVQRAARLIPDSEPDYSGDLPEVQNRPNLTRGLIKLSSDALARDIGAIWTAIESYARNLLHNAKVNIEEPAGLVVKPSPELKALYQRLFGANWLGRANTLLFAGELKTSSMVIACTAAAVFEWVWNVDLPWASPVEGLQSVIGDPKYANYVLRETDPELHLHAVLLRGEAIRVMDKAFQSETIEPVAKQLAEEFMTTIHAQLMLFKAEPSRAQILQRRTEDLAKIFTKALILKGRMRAAPDDYQVAWAASGMEVHSEKMEMIREGPSPQEVTWCITPRVEKLATQESDAEVACAAKVFSQPKLG